MLVLEGTQATLLPVAGSSIPTARPNQALAEGKREFPLTLVAIGKVLQGF
jgi:hypothetical protein